MLHSIFIYQRSTGLTIWQSSYEEGITSDSLTMFSSFFSAIQNFVHELVKQGDQGLRGLDLGTYTVHVSNLVNLDLEIVTVFEVVDKRDKAGILKFHEQLVKKFTENKEMFNFSSWDGNLDHFNFIDPIVTKLFKEFREKEKVTLIPVQMEIAALSKLSEMQLAQNNAYDQESHALRMKLKQITTLTGKLEILSAIESLATKLNDSQGLQEAQKERAKILRDIEDTKVKAAFFLKQTKDNAPIS